MVEGGFLVAIIAGIVLPLCGAMWAYNNYLNSKFDKVSEGFKTVFRRMDERQEENKKEFVRLDIYTETLKHQEEKFDQRFLSNMELMTEKFKTLMSGIDRLEKKFDESQKGRSRRYGTT